MSTVTRCDSCGTQWSDSRRYLSLTVQPGLSWIEPRRTFDCCPHPKCLSITEDAVKAHVAELFRKFAAGEDQRAPYATGCVAMDNGAAAEEGEASGDECAQRERK